VLVRSRLAVGLVAKPNAVCSVQGASLKFTGWQQETAGKPPCVTSRCETASRGDGNKHAMGQMLLTARFHIGSAQNRASGKMPACLTSTGKIVSSFACRPPLR